MKCCTHICLDAATSFPEGVKSLNPSTQATLILCASHRLKARISHCIDSDTDHMAPLLMTLNELIGTDSCPEPTFTESLEKQHLQHCIHHVFPTLDSTEFLNQSYQVYIEQLQDPNPISTRYTMDQIIQRFMSTNSQENWHHQVQKPLSFATRQLLKTQRIITVGFYQVPQNHYSLWSQIITSSKSFYWLSHPKSAAFLTAFWEYLQASFQIKTQRSIQSARPINGSQSTHKTLTTEIQHCIDYILSLEAAGRPLSEIGVICPDMARYMSAVIDACDRFQIPYQSSFSIPFYQTQLGKYMNQLCQSLLSPLSWKTLIHLLVIISKEHTQIWPELFDTSQIPIDATVPSKPQWQTLLKTLKDQESDPIHKKSLALLQRSLDTQSSFIMAFLEDWDRLKFDSKSPEAFSVQIKKMLHYFNPESPLKNSPETKALEKLQMTLSHFSGICQSGNIQDYPSCFQQLLDHLRITAPEHKNGIQILSRKESYGLGLTHMIILGFNTHYWPGNPSHGLFQNPDGLYKWGLSHSEFIKQEADLLLDTVTQSSQLIHLSSLLETSYYPQSTCLAPLAAQPSLPSYADPKQLCQYFGRQLRVSNSIDRLPFSELEQICPDFSFQLKYPIPQDQQLHHPLSLSILQKSQLASRVSASMLDQYQRCPYQFFLKQVLGLITPSQQIGISGAQWGIFIHQLLYQTLNSTGPLRHRLEQNAVALLKEKGLNFDWLVKTDLLLGSDTLLSQLESVLSELMAWSDPVECEYGFGERFNRPVKIQHQDREISLSGQIDLILAHKESGNLIVLDYKTTSTVPKSIEIQHLDKLQFPMYLLAVQMMFPETPVIAAFVLQIHKSTQTKLLCHQTSYKISDFHQESVRPFRFETDYFTQIKGKIIELSEDIAAGQFNIESDRRSEKQLKNQSQSCQYCDYQRICRYPNRYG